MLKIGAFEAGLNEVIHQINGGEKLAYSKVHDYFFVSLPQPGKNSDPSPVPRFGVRKRKHKYYLVGEENMGLDDINFKQISMVMESWELCAQRFSCREEVGLQILLELFQMDPSIKLVFGFQPKQDVGKNPLLRMGALVHGVNIVKMIDSLLGLIGPDTELLAILLAEQGERHARLGVKATHVPLLGQACKKVIRTLVPENEWKVEFDAAWTDVFHEVSSEMIKTMG